MTENFDFLSELGIKPEELKGKSKKEIMDMIVERSSEKTKELTGEQEVESIENIKSKLPKVKEMFENPFEIMVKEVGQTKTPTPVKVVGYNYDNNESLYIVYKGGKLFQIPESDLIKTTDELAILKSEKKGKRKAGQQSNKS